VRQLKIGVTTDTQRGLLPRPKAAWRCTYDNDANSNSIGLARFILTNGVYFIYHRYPSGYVGLSGAAPSTSVEVFRLPPVPTGYQRQNHNVNGFPRRFQPVPGESPEDAYAQDFLQFVTGDRKEGYGVQYELIYSDPPQPPK
jgi:hypothetical protein